MGRKGIALATVIGLLAFSGTASAQPGPEEEPEDTVLNFAYDEVFHLFLWNTSATDGQYDCTLENGAVNPTYATNGSIAVSALTGGVLEMDVTFPDRDDETAEPLTYSAEGECGLQAAEVAGPNGQVNHGMFLKLFNSLHEGPGGRGCLVRHIAQSPELGKGDQQIHANDPDPDFVPVADGDTGEVVFSTFAADCEHGNNGNGNGPGAASNGGGRPASPGKSGDAPGRNK